MEITPHIPTGPGIWLQRLYRAPALSNDLFDPVLTAVIMLEDSGLLNEVVTARLATFSRQNPAAHHDRIKAILACLDLLDEPDKQLILSQVSSFADSHPEIDHTLNIYLIQAGKKAHYCLENAMAYAGKGSNVDQATLAEIRHRYHHGRGGTFQLRTLIRLYHQTNRRQKLLAAAGQDVGLLQNLNYLVAYKDEPEKLVTFFRKTYTDFRDDERQMTLYWPSWDRPGGIMEFRNRQSGRLSVYQALADQPALWSDFSRYWNVMHVHDRIFEQFARAYAQILVSKGQSTDVIARIIERAENGLNMKDFALLVRLVDREIRDGIFTDTGVLKLLAEHALATDAQTWAVVAAGYEALNEPDLTGRYANWLRIYQQLSRPADAAQFEFMDLTAGTSTEPCRLSSPAWQIALNMPASFNSEYKAAKVTTFALLRRVIRLKDLLEEETNDQRWKSNLDAVRGYYYSKGFYCRRHRSIYASGRKKNRHQTIACPGLTGEKTGPDQIPRPGCCPLFYLSSRRPGHPSQSY